MSAIVKVNGKEEKDLLFILDTLSKKSSIQTFKRSERKVDLDRCYVEVNIFGDVFDE